MQLLSEETLAHYGIKGQRKGYNKGKRNGKDVAKSDYTLSKGFVNNIKSTFGINDEDTSSQVAGKIIAPIATYASARSLGANKYQARSLGRLVSSASAASKANRNAKKLGRKESITKSYIKTYLMGATSTDRYNIRRKKGQGRIRSFLGSTVVDRVKNGLTLGKHTYDLKNKYKLKHKQI